MIEDLQVPENDKERQEWAKNWADGVGRYSHGKRWNDIRYGYDQNHRKFLGELELSDYDHIHSTLGKPKPMLFANYPLFEPMIQQQVGEYTSREPKFGVNRINKNIYSDRLMMESQLAAEKILAPVWARIEKENKIKLPIEKKLQMVPEQFQGMAAKNIRDHIEVNVKYGLNYLYNTYKFGDGLALNLYDIMINDDCFSKVDVVGNDPVIKHVPIQNAIFECGEDNYIVDKVHERSPYMGKDVWMNINEALSHYGHRLKQDQRKKILDEHTSMRADSEMMKKFNNECEGYVAYRNSGGQFQCRVLDFELKAINRKKFLKIPYTPDKEDIYDAKNVSEVWEICKIATQYLEPRKRKNQIPNRGNYFDNQFSYFGMLSRHSFFRKAFPIQLLWNTSWQTLDFLLNTSGGKATRMATERKPDNIEWEDWMWDAKVMGFIQEQIRTGDIPGRNAMGGEVDFGPSASIQYIIQMIMLLKQTAEGMTGISAARKGTAAPTSATSSLQSSILQSSYTTKPIYDVLTRHTETGLQRCADLMVYLWEADETKAYIGGDGLPVVFKVAKDLVSKESGLCSLGIYADSAMQIAQEKEAIMELIRPLLATDANMILEAVKVFNSESGAEAEQILERGIGAIRANMNALEKSKIEIGQKANALKEVELRLREEELKIKAEVPIAVAKVNKEASENVALVKDESDYDQTLLAERAAAERELQSQQHERQLQMQEQIAQQQQQEAEAQAEPVA